MNDPEAQDLTALRAAFPIERCPDCGYRRCGLPPGNRCPECGWLPATEAGVVFYLERPQRQTRLSWHQKLWSIVGVYAVIFGITHVDKALSRSGIRHGWLIVIGLILASLPLTWWYRRGLRQEIGDAIYQMRLGPQGYCVGVGFDKPTWTRWPKRVDIRLDQTLLGKWRLRIGPTIPFVGLVTSWQVDAALPFDAKVSAALARQCSRWAERVHEPGGMTLELDK